MTRESSVITAIVCAVILIFIWVISHIELTELNPAPTQWTATGAKAEYKVGIWIDPQTKCHYYMNVSFSVHMTRRDGPDGKPICNQPVPDGVKSNKLD